TGQAGLVAGLVECAAQLCLTQPVLGAQPLLLLESDGVVGFGPAPRPAVFARRVGALLEVLDGLGRQRDTQGAGGAHLAARTVTGCHELIPVVVGERHTIGHDRADVRGQLQAGRAGAVYRAGTAVG